MASKPAQQLLSPGALEPELRQQDKPLQQRVWYNLSIHLSIYLSIHLFTYLSVHLSIYSPIYPSIYLSIYLSRACLVLVLSCV